MAGWMATRHLGVFADFLMAKSDISTNARQQICGVSQTWPWWCIKRGSSSRNRMQGTSTPQWTFSTTGGAILSPSWPSSSCEVVANQVFCRSCGCIPPVGRNGQWWMHRSEAQNLGFTKSLCIYTYTQSRQDSPRNIRCKPCSYNSDVWGIEWAVAGIVLAMVPVRHFRSGCGSNPNRCQIGGPGRQYTRTVNSGKIRW